MNYREILIRLISMTTPFVYDSEESFLEMLRKFYKYLHELTEASKLMSDDIIDLRNEMTSFEEEINAELERINDILVEYDMKIDRVSNELKIYVDDKIINLRNYVDNQDNLLDERIKNLRSPTLSDMPRGGTPITKEDLIAEKDEKIDRLNRLEVKGKRIKADILDKIDDLDDPRYAEVLESYFIDCKNIEVIADENNYTTRHIERLLADAIESISL